MISTLGVCAAAVTWLGVLVGPAALALRGRWSSHWHWIIGSGPVLTLAMLGLLRGGSELLDIAVHPAVVIAALVSAAIAARVVAVRRFAITRPPAPTSGPGLGLVCVVVASMAVWIVLSTSGRITLGGIDGPRHAYFVDRIMEGSGASATIVLRHDPAVDDPISGYYPLSLHVGAATVQHLTGLGTANVINGLGLVMCGLVLPCGWAAALRRWLSPGAIALTAAVAAFGSLWPWFGWSLGWMPYVAGIVLLPGALALVLRGLDGPRAWPLAALACAGMIATHTGALCVFALVSLAVGVGSRAELRRLVLAGAVAAAAMAPETWQMVTGVLERRDVESPTVGLSTVQVLGWLTGRFSGSTVSVPMVALSVVGFVVGRGRWRALGGVAGGLGVLAVVLADHDRGLVHMIAAPWNADIERLVLTTYALLPPLAAVALQRVFELAASRGRVSQVAGALASVTIAAVATTSALDGARFLTRTPSRWTQMVMERADEAGSGRVLAGYPFDGGLWLGTLDGPPPAFGWPPEFVETPDSWARREQLAALVADPTSSIDSVTSLADDLCVSSVLVVDEAAVADPTYPFDRARMRDAPFLVEVVVGQDASVFAIVGTSAPRCDAG